jgi:hypothetical protein
MMAVLVTPKSPGGGNMNMIALGSVQSLDWLRDNKSF